MYELKLSPSILSADFSKLGEDIQTADQAGAIIFTLMLWMVLFVPNISFGIPVIKSIRKCTDKVFDVHLMIEHPDFDSRSLQKPVQILLLFMQKPASIFTEQSSLIHSLGVKAGVALNPATPLSVLDYVLKIWI